jgi:hypothetical protein
MYRHEFAMDCAGQPITVNEMKTDNLRRVKWQGDVLAF